MNQVVTVLAEANRSSPAGEGPNRQAKKNPRARTAIAGEELRSANPTAAQKVIGEYRDGYGGEARTKAKERISARDVEPFAS